MDDCRVASEANDHTQQMYMYVTKNFMNYTMYMYMLYGTSQALPCMP